MAFTKGTANFTNGSKTVTSVSLTSGQLAYFASGTAVFVQSEGQLIEATGLPKDGSGDVIPNQFLLRDNWAGSTGGYAFVAFDTIEGLRDAVQSARGFSEQLQAFVESAEVNPVANSFVKRNSNGRVKAAPGVDSNDVLVKSQAQESPTDETANALMRVGAFGLGGGAPFTPSTGFDLDDATLKNGWYTVASGQNGSYPVGASTSAILFVSRRSTGNIHQLYFEVGPNPKMYTRVFTTVSWTSWQQVYSQSSIIGTVSQSAGIPTGAIIERGSNSNGEYVKFADGTLICSKTTIKDMACDTAFGNLFFSSEIGGGSYPAQFTTIESASNYVRRSSFNAPIWFSAGTSNLSNASGFPQGWIHSAVSNSTVLTYTLVQTVKGRWD
ncbi:hypothetical protein AWR38_06360 [Idiomarina sp. WRN-38]|nr:hypothetical protein AUR68_06345 [Idiomarina sp. H105]OAE91040.1 hypothetical protein AWR38_06360 [Idiomarina sp. WRN-38]